MFEQYTEEYFVDQAKAMGEELGVDTRQGSVYMDAAAGHGETIVTLAGILNMDSEKLGEMSKQNFATLFPNENVDAVTLTLNVMEMVKQA